MFFQKITDTYIKHTDEPNWLLFSFFFIKNKIKKNAKKFLSFRNSNKCKKIMVQVFEFIISQFNFRQMFELNFTHQER